MLSDQFQHSIAYFRLWPYGHGSRTVLWWLALLLPPTIQTHPLGARLISNSTSPTHSHSHCVKLTQPCVEIKF